MASALVVVTCNVARERPPASAPSPLDTLAYPAASAESAAPPLPTAEPTAPAPTAAAPDAGAPGDPRAPGHELDRFYAALRALDARSRRDHVRLAWLGDSHGAADIWSGALREALQARFGSGGPGFLHLGYKAYRHDGVKVETQGRWATSPKGPSTIVPTGDGVFGLGGVLLTGSADGPRAGLTITEAQLPPALRWDLCWKPGSAQDELKLTLTGQPDRSVKPAASEPLGRLQHVQLESKGATPKLTALPLAGQPRLCGVVAETDPKAKVGVVLDTLGINGARHNTPLAWDEAAWISELSRRRPELVILEYGTNESGDHSIKAERYVDDVKKLMARVHKASPECDCLVLAPTDRADTPDRTPQVRDALKAAARASGCLFWDTYEIMGGKGAITAWKTESPPKAAPDGVHLNHRGYRELGEKLAEVVLGGYRP